MAARPRIKLRTTPSSPVGRLFGVLELAGQIGTISVADVVDTLDLPRPTAHRLVATLEGQGYLQRRPAKGRFGPAPRLVELAAAVLNSTLISAPIQTVLADLARRTGETCSLAILSSGMVEYVASAVGDSPLTLQFQAGQRAPIYCTSTGRALLSGLSESHLSAYMSTGPWSAITPHTITNPAKLQDRVRQTRATGFALNDSEYIVGVVGVAVPVKNKQGQVLASLTISAPKIRKSIDDLKALLPALRQSAMRISRVI
jgi:IclR family acetate operon transcriptional repressor